MTLTPQQQAALLDLARATIRHRLAARERDAAPPPLPPSPSDDAELRQPAGCFVSLHALQTRRLRGCVGRVDAEDPLIAAVQAAAVSVLSDPRFTSDPVTLAELPALEIELSVLSPLRPAPGPLAFDPLEDGVYLTCGRRSGCFLPQVARETGWTREQLLDRLCTEKMDLPAHTWRTARTKLFLFSTLLVGPEPFVPRASITSVSALGGVGSHLR